MLVLARKPNQSIVIVTPEGRRIVITLVDTGYDRAKIGIMADRDVTVNRSEIQALVDAGRGD